MNQIVIPTETYLQIIRHVMQATPREAVGLIGGTTDGYAREVIALPNLAGPHEFFADPFAQFQAERRFSQEGLSILAIYHSHPDGGTNLSEADKLLGADWNCTHIVIVPERLPAAAAMRAWNIAGDTVSEVSIVRGT